MDIAHWLSGLDLAQYAGAFAENDIDADVLPELTEDDLRDLGVSSIGHRRKLMKAIHALGAPQPAAPATARGAAVEDGERRHLTVMFVDLVGSTEMSNRLDPEDWSAFISTYQNTVAGIVARHDGYVAHFLGDGVLCYFGFPSANEDDAERSVRAGLEAIEAVRNLSLPDNRRPATRIGIATGLVVVSDLIASGGVREATVIGETPNLAARLQGLAEQNQIVLAPATKEILGGVFELRSMGRQTLKGIEEAVETFTVVGENIRESRFAAHKVGELTPIVGRDSELSTIRTVWSGAKRGAGGVVLLVGEAGIGKSRLVQAALDDASADPLIKVIYQCSPYHTDSALHPIIQQMLMAAGVRRDMDTAEKLALIERLPGMTADNIPLIAPLLGVDATGAYPALNLNPAQQRAATLQALIAIMMQQSAIRPLLIVFEDLHWIDPTSLELLDLAATAVKTGHVLVLATARPSFRDDLPADAMHRIPLSRLNQTTVNDIIAKVSGGKSMPAEVAELINARTDGVPLFVEELTKTILESGVLHDADDAYVLDQPLDHVAIPNTLQDSLMARLDRMNTVKRVAQTASCIGREFSFRLLSRIAGMDAAALERDLAQLTEAELIYASGAAPDSSYMFKHALVRDTAYDSLLRGRRRDIHRDILEVLQSDPGVQPEVLATHAEAAGQTDRAITLWQAAGEGAVARPAFDEGIASFGRALALLAPQVEAGEAAAMERALPLLMKEGVASMARRGWGNLDTKASFERALALDEQLGGTPLRLTILYALMTTHIPRGEPREAVKRGPAFVELAERSEDPAAVVANRSFGISLSFAGEFGRAQGYYDRALELFDAEKHANLAAQWGQDVPIATHAVVAMNCALRGETRRGEALFAECERFGDLCDDINSNAYKHMSGSMLRLVTREDAAFARHSARLAEMSAEHRLSFFGMYAAMTEGLAQVMQGDPEGLTRFDAADRACVEANALCMIPALRTEAARRAHSMGLTEQAHDLTARAMRMIEDTGEEMLLSDLHRMRAALEDDPAAAEHELRAAIAVARRQSAKLFELRAAGDLARLLQSQGRSEEAAQAVSAARTGVAAGDCAAEMEMIRGVSPDA